MKEIEKKQTPYLEAEWVKDKIYNEYLQEKGIKQVINYYTKIKMEVEEVI